MSKNFYHVYRFESDKPNSRVIGVDTYSRRMDIPDDIGGVYRIVTGSSKTPMCIDIPYGKFTLYIGGNVFVYRHDSIKKTIDGWMNTIEEFTPAEREIIKNIHKAFYGDEYGIFDYGVVKLEISED